MDNCDILTTTGDSIQISRRSAQSQSVSHKKTRTIEFSIPRLRQIRKNSDQTDSKATIIDNPNISLSLNTHKLKLSLRSIYDIDPIPKLKQIFKEKPEFTPKCSQRTNGRLKNISNQRRRRGKLDSMFEENEAELIRSELNNIKSPKIWSQVVQNFKQSPSVLMDLVPLE